jgi:hypothetical protein
MMSSVCGGKRLGAALFILIVAAGQASAADLARRWIVRWGNDPKNENTLSLTLHDARLSGTYINDSKENCAVTGNIKKQTSKFALTIVCPRWDIRMEGSQSDNGKTAGGSYQAYIDSHGDFTMRRM